MVRYEGLVRHLRPLRVHQTVSQQLQTGKLAAEPSWYRVLGAYPPATTLVRTLPVQLSESRKPSKRNKRPRKLFMPQEIVYPEDRLRARFFKDHPWELARPRVLVEDSGEDAKYYNWATGLRQPGKPVDGESVVQRQMWLMEHGQMSETDAYDKARREFYAIRMEEDIERRIAKEEALHVGAYFGKGALEVSFELEQKQMDKWKEDAAAELQLRKSRAADAGDDFDVTADDAAAAGGTEPAAPAV